MDRLYYDGYLLGFKEQDRWLAGLDETGIEETDDWKEALVMENENELAWVAQHIAYVTGDTIPYSVYVRPRRPRK